MEERRTEIRRRALKAGKIVIDNQSIIDCTVRTLTYKGASLEIVSPIGIPDIFELSIPVDNFARKCRVSWKQSHRIGVTFL
jgi:hypothetical protein